MNEPTNRTQAPILVTGGTGTLGRHVVERLRSTGHDVRILTRQSRRGEAGVQYVSGDLITGAGVDAAVAGVETIVHCAGTAKGNEEETRNLVRAAGKAGSPHLVYISVVGTREIPLAGALDRAMFGYFGSKLAAERLVESSGLPWTILRATQFHDLVTMVVEKMARLPVVPVPAGIRFQPVDAGEVADRLVELALGEPSGRVPDMGGPRVYLMADMVRAFQHSQGIRRPLLGMRLPGSAARAFRNGVNLAPHRAVGRRSWEDFMAERGVTVEVEAQTLSRVQPTAGAD